MVLVVVGNLDFFDEERKVWLIWGGDFVDVVFLMVGKLYFIFERNKKFLSFFCELEICEVCSYCLYFYFYFLYFKGVWIIKIKMSVSEELNDLIVD